MFQSQRMSHMLSKHSCCRRATFRLAVVGARQRVVKWSLGPDLQGPEAAVKNSARVQRGLFCARTSAEPEWVGSAPPKCLRRTLFAEMPTAEIGVS